MQGKGSIVDNGILQDVETIAEGIDPLHENPRTKIIMAAVAVAIALLSFFVIAPFASSTETHAGTIETLDQKKGTVMGLVAASTAASAAVSLLPGDAGSPIATKLVDLSSDFLIVITAIYLEKYLLTTLGFAAFKVLIPLGCILLAIALFINRRLPMRQALMRLSAKLALFGVAIFLVVPVSIGVSGMIEATYQDSVDETLELANETTATIEESVKSEAAAEAQSASPLEWLANIPSTVGDSLAGMTNDAQKALNGFVEALAVMIVTSCIIPILVLVFFLWLVKIILGVDVTASVQLLRPRTFGGGGRI